MAPAAIVDLPATVQMCLLEIIVCQSNSDASSLSQTCKALCGVSQMFLYRSIELDIYVRREVSPVRYLLRTLIETPELGLYVRSLKLKGLRDNIQLSFSPDLHLEQDMYKVFVSPAGIEALSSVPKNFAKGLRRGQLAFIVAFFLAKMPNLASLLLDSYFRTQNKHFESFLEASLPNGVDDPQCKAAKTAIESLHHVSFVSLGIEEMVASHANYHKPPQEGLLLFFLPNIQHLSVAMPDHPRPFWAPTNIPNPTALTTLDISRVCQSRLAEVLSIIPNLKRLTYLWQCGESGNGNPMVDLDMISTAIVQRKDTLEELTIIDHSPTASMLQNPEVRGSLIQFAQLYHLKKLQLPWTFVAGLGEKVLPPGKISAILPPYVERLKMAMTPGFFSYLPFHDWVDKDFRDVFEAEVKRGALRHCRSLREVRLPGAAELYCQTPNKWMQISKGLSETTQSTFRIYQLVRVQKAR